MRGTSSKAAPVVVGILGEVCEPTGAGRHGVVVEGAGVLCRRLGDLAGVAG